MDFTSAPAKGIGLRVTLKQMFYGALFLVAFRALVLFVLFNISVSMAVVFILSFIVGPGALSFLMYLPIFLPLLLGKFKWTFGAALMALLLYCSSLGMHELREHEASRYTTAGVTSPSRHHDLVASVGSSILDVAYFNASEQHRIADKTKDGWDIFQRTARSACGENSFFADANPFLLKRSVCLKRTFATMLDDALVFRQQRKEEAPVYDANGEVVPFPAWFTGDSIVFSEILNGKEFVLGRRLKWKGYRKKNALSTQLWQLILGGGDWDRVDQGPNIDAWVFLDFARRTPERQVTESFALSGECKRWPPVRKPECRSE